jgi:methionyl-tRNA formyltransferase
MKFVYFGTPKLAVTVLEELRAKGYAPSLIVTTPDMPQGRKLVLTPTPVKSYAIEHSIPVITPAKLREEGVAEALAAEGADLFIVAAYGKIIPQHILDIPTKGTINVHPSLLPKLRGPSPIESVILSKDQKTGVSIMKLDAEIDHGPIIAQIELAGGWDRTDPPKGSELEDKLAHEGGKLLSMIIDPWMRDDIKAYDQDHGKATFCKMIEKKDGEIDLQANPVENIKKIRAYDAWPGTFFFTDYNGRNIRVRITEAHIESGALILDKVIPEGKNEMSYSDFLRGKKS